MRRLPSAKRLRERASAAARYPSASLLESYYTHLAARRGPLAPLAQPGNPVVVTLTSYGMRVEHVHIAIESIGSGTLRPGRLILWLEPKDMANVTPALISQQQRGLEIRECPNLGPHKKYYPFVISQENHFLPYATADDDVIYPRQWLRRLMQQSTGERVITCHRARRIVFDQSDRLQPYNNWPMAYGTSPSLLNFATGVSGVLYPPSFSNVVRDAGEGFKERAPMADDLWLHRLAIRNGYSIRQTRAKARHFPELTTAAGTGLMQGNVIGQANDAYIANLYGQREMEILLYARSDPPRVRAASQVRRAPR